MERGSAYKTVVLYIFVNPLISGMVNQNLNLNVTDTVSCLRVTIFSMKLKVLEL